MDTAANLDTVDRIDAVLPQTQCRRCGYDGCRPYAEAIEQGDAINRCPPGGDAVIAALAAITARGVIALDRSHGAYQPLRTAHIDEARCIGCTICIQACPVDAIIGAARQMHTVLAALCTGCELCLAPCPVDCIEMPVAGRAWSAEDARAARLRYVARNARVALRSHDGHSRNIRDGDPRKLESQPSSTEPLAANAARQRRQQHIAAARARARMRRAGESGKARAN